MKFHNSLFVALLLCFSVCSTAFSESKPEIKYVQVNGVKLAYYIKGNGKPLLMINGFLSTMSLWDPALLDRLAKKHTLILFDNRGVGFSSDTKENHTTIPKMADDAAGLIRQLGYKKIDILAWSMGARIGQQLLIRHPELVGKAILCSANPGGRHAVATSAAVESRLNDPNLPEMKKMGLVFPDNHEGREAASECLARIKNAAKSGSIPNDFTASHETSLRQTRARTVLWSGSDANFNALKHIRNSVLLADGRDDVIDRPQNSVVIANQIPFAWTAFLKGGHAFLFQSNKQFAALVDAFLL
jgi:pimeloyl-ACP methyl ester carboxylesterase